MSVPNKTDEKSRCHLTATLARINRLSYDANVSRTDLLQTFLPAFEEVVREGKVRGVMCAYNRLDQATRAVTGLLTLLFFLSLNVQCEWDAIVRQ